MADSRADASITIGADLSPMRAAFAEAQGLVKSKMGGIANDATTALKGVAVAFAGAFAVKGILNLVNDVAEARAQLKDLSEVTGTSVENLSKIQGVAKLTGTSMDEVGGAIVKLTKNLASGDEEGGKAADALAKLGISARNADGSLRDSGEVYLEVSKKLGEFEDGAGKTAIAIDLFGKTGAQQLPLLKDLAEAGDLEAKVTKEQAYQADEYEKNLKRLSIAMGANKKIIAGELIPVADDFVKSLLEMISGTDGLTKELKTLAADGSLKQWGRNAAEVAAFVIDAFDGVTRAFQITGKVLGGVGAAAAAAFRGDFGQIKTILDDTGKDIDGILAKKLFSDRLKEQFAKSDAAAGQPTPERKKLDYRGGNTGGGGRAARAGRLEDTSRAEYAVAKAQLEAALALQKQYLSEAESANEEAYRNNLIDIRTYYDARIAAEQEGLRLEMEAKRKEIEETQRAQGTATTDRERLSLKAQEIKLTGDLAVLTAKSAQVVITETRAMTAAERQRADALREVQIASQFNIGNSQIAMERIELDTRRQLRQTSDAQAIEEERSFEDRITSIQLSAIQQRLEMERAGTNDPVRIAALNAQIEDLERQHQERLTQIDAQAVVERNRYATEAANAVQGNFQSFFNDLTDRSKKLSDVFRDLGKNIMRSLNDVASKKLAEQLFGGGSTGGGLLNQAMGALFGGSAVPAKAGGAGSGSSALADPLAGDFMGQLRRLFGGTDKPSSGRSAAGESANVTELGQAAATATGGIQGMFDSASNWIAKNLLGITAEQTKTTTTATATGALSSLTTAATGAAQALTTIPTSAGGAAGSPAKPLLDAASATSAPVEVTPVPAAAAGPNAGGAAEAIAGSTAALGELGVTVGTVTQGMSALSTGGIGGMFKAAGGWIAKTLLGTVAETSATTATAASAAALAPFTAAVYAATAALSTMGSSAGASSGGNLFGSLVSSGASASGSMDFSTFASWFSAAGGASFDTGTDFVPRDMLAMVHRGEKITPAKFNTPAAPNSTIVQHINVPENMSRASASELAREVGVRTQAAVRRNG